jgi:hypothetical protein
MEERCEKTGLVKSQCSCDQCKPNPLVFVTKYSKEYHSDAACSGIREGHYVAEIRGNEVHPVETITRWAAESRGLLRHRCTVIQAQDRSTD